MIWDRGTGPLTHPPVRAAGSDSGPEGHPWNKAGFYREGINATNGERNKILESSAIQCTETEK